MMQGSNPSVKSINFILKIVLGYEQGVRLGSRAKTPAVVARRPPVSNAPLMKDILTWITWGRHDPRMMVDALGESHDPERRYRRPRHSHLRGRDTEAASLLGYIGMWGWIGVIPLATGLFRFCPSYLPFGLSTCEAKTTGARR